MAKLTIENGAGQILEAETRFRNLTLTLKGQGKFAAMEFTITEENHEKVLEMLLGIESFADFVAGWASRNRYDIEDALADRGHDYGYDQA